MNKIHPLVWTSLFCWGEQKLAFNFVNSLAVTDTTRSTDGMSSRGGGNQCGRVGRGRGGGRGEYYTNKYGGGGRGGGGG